MTTLSNYEHRPGDHAGTTALANLARYRGVDVSEAIVFGVGGGLHFGYERRGAEAGPSRRITGRSEELEQRAAAALGFEFGHRDLSDASDLPTALADLLGRDRPVMIECIRGVLPFVDEGLGRPESIVVVGYSAEEDLVQLADHSLEDIQTTEFASLRQAVEASRDSWTLSWIDGSGRDVDEAAVEAGLDQMSANMEASGLEQLRAFADEVGGWGDLSDAAACFRDAHHQITHAADDGSLFRSMTREFIADVREMFPGVCGVRLGIAITKCAQGWNTLADYLIASAESIASDERPAKDPLHHVESLAEAIYQYESALSDLISFR